MRMGKTNCNYCNKEYERPVKRINAALKNGTKQYCCQECNSKDKARIAGIEIRNCTICSKEIRADRGRQENTTSGKLYCSRLCYSKADSFGHKKSEESKRKASESIKRTCRRKGLTVYEEKSCPVCGVVFRAKNKTCSNVCGLKLKLGYEITKEDLDKFLTDIRSQTDIAPSTKMIPRRYYSSVKRHYESWNKAMKIFGFVLNTQWVSRKCLSCKDGHVAHSISEMVVDNWLYDNGIKHERFKRYPGSRRDCDFYLPDSGQWVEYFGLKGETKEYDKGIEEKRVMAKEHGLQLVELTCDDLFPSIKIKEKFADCLGK